MTSTLLVCMAFSSGMPILYLIAFVFFFATYVINKVMLMQYYQKTNTLNRVVPAYSVKKFKIGIFFHLYFGIFMMTNPSIFETKDEFAHPLNTFNDSVSNDSMYFSRIQFAHQKVYIAFVLVSTVCYFFQSTLKTLFHIVTDLLKSFYKYLTSKVLIKCFKGLGICQKKLC